MHTFFSEEICAVAARLPAGPRPDLSVEPVWSPLDTDIPLSRRAIAATIEASGLPDESTVGGETIMVIDPVSALWLDMQRRSEMKRRLQGTDEPLARRARKQARKK